MAFYDGTTDETMDELKKEYPREITDTLRASEDGKQLAIINKFKKGSLHYKLADPKVEMAAHKARDYVFYHVLVGSDAEITRQFMEDYLAQWDGKDIPEIMLFRQDKDRLFSYEYGTICTGRIRLQNSLKYGLLDADEWEKQIYIIPLKRKFYECPICGRLNALYAICEECGFEEFFHLDVDAYRRKYLRLKRENPAYKYWLGHSSRRHVVYTCPVCGLRQQSDQHCICKKCGYDSSVCGYDFEEEKNGKFYDDDIEDIKNSNDKIVREFRKDEQN